MFATGRALPGSDLVSLNVTPPPPRLRQQTDYNTAWNMRTLVLLARAGLIELGLRTSNPPRAAVTDETEEASRPA